MLMFIFASIQNAMFKLQVEGKNVHGPFKMQADFALEDTELFEFSTEHMDSDSHRIMPGDTI